MTFTNYSAGSEAKEGIRDLKTYSRGYWDTEMTKF